jgi:hypothetical protein
MTEQQRKHAYPRQAHLQKMVARASLMMEHAVVVVVV